MRSLFSLLLLCCAGYGAWYFASSRPEVKSQIDTWLDSGTFNTLEVRFTADQLMETHKKALLKDHRHKYLEPVLKFYPYSLMEVKYIVGDKTVEGVMLWDLYDGEMVLDTADWDKTHGFGDCINARAEREEFKVINILAKKGGSCDRQELAKLLHIENDILDGWVEGLRKKQLIVQTGNKYRLHLQNPKLKALPETRIDQRLVTKPFKNALRATKNYSLAQIERVAKSAFGNNFAVKRTTDVFLPVYSVTVENPDGSIHTSHWNALNGKPYGEGYFIH